MLVLGVAVSVHSESESSPELWVWVDSEGITQLTDDASGVPPGAEGVGGFWEGPLGRDTVGSRKTLGQREARMQRLLRGAVADLQRGETTRAAVVLESVLRDQPAHPEAHWYLALLDRHRGRYESAGAHLEAFLASAGEDLSQWRASAERRLRELADERRLADEGFAGREDAWIETASEHFEVHYDVELGRATPDYANTVMRYLEEARDDVGGRIGAYPAEHMGVVFYGKAAYNRAHGHRFSFQTVGFFDGRIHVVSAAHPAGELRALLFHEYVHALYRERTGGDRPYWLNEGLAELSERASRRRPRLTRSERSLLRRRIDAGAWIPLRRLAPSFSGLNDDDARSAYLEATAAAAWIEDHSTGEQRGAMLAELGRGRPDDAVFMEGLQLDTAAIDEQVREWIRSEFPETAERTPTETEHILPNHHALPAHPAK
jgi:tetratricopeptide (TPR) repeat protein